MVQNNKLCGILVAASGLLNISYMIPIKNVLYSIQYNLFKRVTLPSKAAIHEELDPGTRMLKTILDPFQDLESHSWDSSTFPGFYDQWQPEPGTPGFSAPVTHSSRPSYPDVRSISEIAFTSPPDISSIARLTSMAPSIFDHMSNSQRHAGPLCYKHTQALMLRPRLCHIGLLLRIQVAIAKRLTPLHR